MEVVISSKNPKNSKDPKGSNSPTVWVTILLAVIGLVGTLGAAYLSRPSVETEVSDPNPPSPSKENPEPEKVELDPKIPEHRKLAITEVTAQNDNFQAGRYNPGRMIDGSCGLENYWASTYDLNVVLDFELEQESTVSEIGFLSTRISGPNGNSLSGTQPKMLKLTFFDANNELITEREIRPSTPTIQPIFTKFYRVEGVSRIQMQPLEPIETDKQRFSFNEVEFHGHTSDVSETSGSTSGCLDRTAVSLNS